MKLSKDSSLFLKTELIAVISILAIMFVGSFVCSGAYDSPLIATCIFIVFISAFLSISLKDAYFFPITITATWAIFLIMLVPYILVVGSGWLKYILCCIVGFVMAMLSSIENMKKLNMNFKLIVLVVFIEFVVIISFGLFLMFVNPLGF